MPQIVSLIFAANIFNHALFCVFFALKELGFWREIYSIENLRLNEYNRKIYFVSDEWNRNSFRCFANEEVSIKYRNFFFMEKYFPFTNFQNMLYGYSTEFIASGMDLKNFMAITTIWRGEYTVYILPKVWDGFFDKNKSMIISGRNKVILIKSGEAEEVQERHATSLTWLHKSSDLERDYNNSLMSESLYSIYDVVHLHVYITIKMADAVCPALEDKLKRFLEDRASRYFRFTKFVLNFVYGRFDEFLNPYKMIGSTLVIDFRNDYISEETFNVDGNVASLMLPRTETCEFKRRTTSMSEKFLSNYFQLIRKQVDMPEVARYNDTQVFGSDISFLERDMYLLKKQVICLGLRDSFDRFFSADESEELSNERDEHSCFNFLDILIKNYSLSRDEIITEQVITSTFHHTFRLTEKQSEYEYKAESEYKSRSNYGWSTNIPPDHYPLPYFTIYICYLFAAILADHVIKFLYPTVRPISEIYVLNGRTYARYSSKCYF